MNAWDPTFDFLLELRPDNLFERRSAAPGRDFETRCKGCGELTTLRDHEKHHAKHKRERSRQRAREIETNRNRALTAARKARRHAAA